MIAQNRLPVTLHKRSRRCCTRLNAFDLEAGSINHRYFLYGAAKRWLAAKIHDPHLGGFDESVFQFQSGNVSCGHLNQTTAEWRRTGSVYAPNADHVTTRLFSAVYRTG